MPKYSCRYRSAFEKEFPYVSKSSTSATSAYCKLCKRDFSVAAGGSNDIKRHAQCKKHKEAVKAKKITAALSFPQGNEMISKVGSVGLCHVIF